MPTNHIPYRHFIDDIEWKMCMLRWTRVAHVRHQFVIVYWKRAIGEWHARRPPICVHRPRPMRVVYVWRLLSYVHMSWSWNSTTNVSWTIPVVVSRCHFLDEDRDQMMLRAVVRRQYRTTNTGQLKFPAVVQCRLPEAHWPLLMLPDVGQWKGHPTDAHTLFQCVQGFANVSFHWPTFPSR